MQFSQPLVPGTLIRRYKRFLADVHLDDGREVTAHTPNSGRMAGCSEPGSRCWLSPADKPSRKLKWTLEIVVTPDTGVAVGVNTQLSNHLAAEAIEAGLLPTLAGADLLRREVRYGEERSRIDLLLQGGATGTVWVEVKNATLVEHGVARFPDAVTERGRKHLRELQRMVEAGDRAVVLFTVQRADAEALGPADTIDPAYGDELRRAAAAGVELYACQAEVLPSGVRLVHELPVVLDR